MSAQDEDKGASSTWSAERLQKALDDMRNPPIVPLTAAELATVRNLLRELDDDQIETLKEIISEWNYQKQSRERRSETFKKNWPIIALAVSVGTSVLGWVVSVVIPRLFK